MNAPIKHRFSRRALLKGGALTVAFALTGLRTASAQGAAVASRILDNKQVDAFLAVNSDGTVTLTAARSISARACASRSRRSPPKNSVSASTR